MSKLKEALKIYFNDPVKYAKEVCNFNPTPQQEAILSILPQAIKEKKGVAVKSGHGTGKTAMEAICIKWFMDTRPFCKVIATAPTQHQLYDVTWAELSKWNSKSFTKNVYEWTATHFKNKIHPENWFAVARTSNKPENMQGFHSENLLFIVEEASGIKTDVLEVIEGTQTQEGSLVLMFGNPTQISGGFYDAFHSKRQFYYCFTLNAEESPMVSKTNCEKIASKYGKDSDVYRVRVLGEFPKAEPDTLISLDKVERAVMREIKPLELFEYEYVEIGVDVARFGDDKTSIYSRIGNIITEEKIIDRSDLMYIVGEVVNLCNTKFKHKICLVNVDDSGLGGGVTDRLKELAEEKKIKAEIYGVNNGSKAQDNDLYMNVGTEMWFYMRDKIDELQIPNDNELIAQLSVRKHKFSSTGKNLLEPKQSLKDRGLPSPDRADGAILTLRSLIYGLDSNESWSYAC